MRAFSTGMRPRRLNSDRIAELSDHDQVHHRPARDLQFCLPALLPNQVRHSPRIGPANPHYPPESAVDAARLLAALGQEPNLVPPSHRAAWEFYRLGNLALEVKASRQNQLITCWSLAG